MREIIILLSLLALVACARPSTVPDWLDGEPEAYPAERYLIGRGQADSSALARDRARADLAKTFTVKVSEQSVDQLLWEQGGDGLQSLQAQASRDIRTQTDKLVEGILIAETWRSEEGGDYHVLAVLDRQQVNSRLRSRINQLDRETAAYINRARSESSLPEQIAAARNALRAQIDRAYEQQMLSIVDSSGTGVPPRYDLARLKNDYELLLDRWKIAAVVKRDELGDLGGLLSGALANIGVLHQSAAAQADYLLVGELSGQELKGADGWYWLRGVLEVALQDTKSGRVIGRHQWSFKSSSRQAEMLEMRTRKQLAATLDAELLDVLIGFGHDQQGSN